jgi:predicted DNA-binding protein
MKKELLSVRLPADLKARLDRASDQTRDPYAPARARIIERGIELALREIEIKKTKR